MKGTRKNKNTEGMREGSRQYNDQLFRIEVDKGKEVLSND